MTGQLRALSRDPWFSGRPLATLAVVVALFAAVFGLRLATDDPGDVVAMLYTLPIALAAVAFGRRGGVAAGLVGVALVVAWVLLVDVHVSPVGWASRCLPLLLLGALLGDATDRLQRTEDERLALERAAERHRDAVEINDTIVQGMSAAKWSLEAGNLDRGLATLSDTLRLAHELVSDLLRGAEMGPSSNGSTRRRSQGTPAP